MEAPPGYASASLPEYSPIASSHDRSSTTHRPIVPNVPGEVYQYDSGRLVLNLGPKRWGTSKPVYGWEDIIEGYVHVKKNTNNVHSVIATIEGHVTTGRAERGIIMDQTQKPVLQVSRTLYDSSSGPGALTSGKRYPFFFPLPSYVRDGLEPLPPTFAALRMGVATDVTYYIQVEMIRKGKLRQNERIKAFFFYLPRTYAPPPLHDPPNHRNENHFEWQRLEVVPRANQGNVPFTAPDLAVSFALPRLRIFACRSKIPFFLKITSGATTEAISSLFTSISVLLIRVTTIRAGISCITYESILGGEEIDRVEEREDERILSGSVNCLRTGESSWHVDGVEIKYLMRVKVSPRSDLPGLARTLPTFQYVAGITMRTHYQTLDGIEDTAIPELSRMPGA